MSKFYLTTILLTTGFAFSGSFQFINHKFNIIQKKSNHNKIVDAFLGFPRSSQIFSSKGQGSGIPENPMNPERYTEKAWNAISTLPAYAEKYNQQYAEATLVLKALLDDGPAGLTQRVLKKAGVDISSFER